MTPSLIFCADGNPRHARAAIDAGWLYGVRLPAKGMLQDVPLTLADQDWKHPDRAKYMALLATHRPALATCLDWEHPEQYAEVMSWAEEVSHLATEAVLIVAKVPGGVPDIPREINGKEVRVAYSVPTSYGASPLGLWELRGRPVHLLGGMPHRQMELIRYLRAEVKSADGNVIKRMATSRCLYWTRQKSKTGHWQALGGFDGDGPLEAVRRSCENVMAAWREGT
jgi:hypothetical protein